MENPAYTENHRADTAVLVEDYLPLVKKIGLHLIARMPREVELDDLMQVGMIGLIQASGSYDPSQNASFATYAGIRIKGAMLDEVRRNDWKPRSVQQSMKRVSAAIRQLEARLSRSATDTEIAAELDMPIEEYHALSRELVCSRMLSLEESGAEDAADEDNPFSRLQGTRLKEALADAITSLPEKEKMMMSLYYTEELNLKEIGAVLGVSESRVSQIHGQALARIRVRVGEWVE